MGESRRSFNKRIYKHTRDRQKGKGCVVNLFVLNRTIIFYEEGIVHDEFVSLDQVKNKCFTWWFRGVGEMQCNENSLKYKLEKP